MKRKILAFISLLLLSTALPAQGVGESEVRRIVLFGSFVNSDKPHDLDVAVFQDSQEKYLPLALKYRRRLRTVSQRIPLDVIPLKVGIKDDPFVREVQEGETIFER